MIWLLVMEQLGMKTNLSDNTEGIYIDDHILDVRKGVRLRMSNEHEWPSSGVAATFGKHKFITLQEQGAKPTLSGTQEAAVYVKTDLALYFENSAGTEIPIVSAAGLVGTATGVAQVVNSMYGGFVTATSTFPWDDSIPQVGEGDEVMSLAITPK